MTNLATGAPWSVTTYRRGVDAFGSEEPAPDPIGELPIADVWWVRERVDDAVTALAWAIYEPNRCKELAELAVQDTGLGNVHSKITKNSRKTHTNTHAGTNRLSWS